MIGEEIGLGKGNTIGELVDGRREIGAAVRRAGGTAANDGLDRISELLGGRGNGTRIAKARLASLLAGAPRSTRARCPPRLRRGAVRSRRLRGMPNPLLLILGS
ncbi:MAG: hypothetical protein V2A73_00640 [Pseudomonadota bacterium]